MKKNKISKDWIIKQHRDQYFKNSKSHGYRSRSAYKLIELDNKFKFFKKKKIIIDLGCYPGGWSQVAKENTDKSKILSLDLKKMDKLQGVQFICRDFQKDETKKEVLKILGEKADVLMSDMAANTTGNKSLDSIRTNALTQQVIDFSRFVLKDDGVVICKLFTGQDFLEIKDLAKKKFKKVDFFKPKSSKDFSKETYIHCKGIKTL